MPTEGHIVVDPAPFVLPNGRFQQVNPVPPASGQGNNKIKKKVMILRKGARGLPNRMKIARIRKDHSLYGMVHLDKGMKEKEVRSEVEEFFFKLEDVGYKFGAADKFGRLNFHENEDEEWTAANIGKWVKNASVLYIVPEVEVDDASDDSEESSDESNQRSQQTLQKTTLPHVLARPTSGFSSNLLLAQCSSSMAFQSEGYQHCQQPLQLNYSDAVTPVSKGSVVNGNSNHGSAMEVDCPTAITHPPVAWTISEDLCQPPPIDDDLGFSTWTDSPLWDPVSEGGYYGLLYTNKGDNTSAAGGEAQLPAIGLSQGTPQQQQKLASSSSTTSSGIEEDKSDSSAILELSEFRLWPISTNCISEMSPDTGPLKGGNKFMMLLKQDLPKGIDFPVKVKFGNLQGGTVDAFLKDNGLIGNKIPASPVPGVVRVVVETQTDQYVGETEYTYEEEDKKKLLNVVKSSSDPSFLSELFFTVVGKMKNHTISANDSPASSNLLSQLFDGGYSEKNFQTQILDILEVMVYLAAEKDGQQFLEAIFSTPVGQVLFKNYRDKSAKPQDVAQENGHVELAEFLDNIEQRFKQSGQDCSANDEPIDWEMVIEAVQKFTDDHNQARETSTARTTFEESDDDSYHADDEATLSSSSNEDDEEDLSYTLALRKLESISHPNVLVSLPGLVSPIETLGEYLQMSSHLNTKLLICITIAEGLSYLHNKNVLHRDICPENILVVAGSCQIAITKAVRVLDCKEHQDRENGIHTHLPELPYVPEYKSKLKDFSPTYAAPECIKEGRFSTASDVFSLGCVIWELVTHKQLRSESAPSDSPTEWLQTLKVNEKEPKLSEEESISDHFSKLLEKCWSVDRRERPSSWEVKQTLDRIRKEAILQDASDRTTTLNAINQLGSHNELNPVAKTTTADTEDVLGSKDEFIGTKSYSGPKDKLTSVEQRFEELTVKSCNDGRIQKISERNNPLPSDELSFSKAHNQRPPEKSCIEEGEDFLHQKPNDVSNTYIERGEPTSLQNDTVNKRADLCITSSNTISTSAIKDQNHKEQAAFNENEEKKCNFLNPGRYEAASKTFDSINPHRFKKGRYNKTFRKEQSTVGNKTRIFSFEWFFTGLFLVLLLSIDYLAFGYHEHLLNCFLQDRVTIKISRTPFVNQAVASSLHILVGAPANVTLSKNNRAAASISRYQTKERKLTTDKCPVQNTSELSCTAAVGLNVASLKHGLVSSFSEEDLLRSFLFIASLIVALLRFPLVTLLFGISVSIVAWHCSDRNICMSDVISYLYEDLSHLSNPGDWRILAEKFGIRYQNIVNFDMNSTRSCQDMLSKWAIKKDATLYVLTFHLNQMGCEDCLEKIEQYWRRYWTTNVCVPEMTHANFTFQ